jgi:hypothetical protein
MLRSFLVPKSTITITNMTNNSLMPMPISYSGGL